MWGRGCRRLLPAPFAFHDERWAGPIIPINDLAVHTVEALVGIDLAERVDRLHHAVLGAKLAFVAALLAPLQPVEHAPAAGNRERGAEHAEVAAVEALDEETGPKKQDCEEHERPFTHEVQEHDRLEWLDLGELLGKRHIAQRDTEQAEKQDVFY